MIHFSKNHSRRQFDSLLPAILRLNKNVTFNKTKHVLVENELNELSEKVKAISTEGLAKYLINKTIPNYAKYLYSGIFQNYLVFIPAKKYIIQLYFNGTIRTSSRRFDGMSEEHFKNITK